MPDGTPSQLLDQLSQARAALCHFMRATQAGHATNTGRDQPAALQLSGVHVRDLRVVFDAVARANEMLSVSATDSQETAAAISEYRQVLRQFRSILPQLRGWLLAERGRLGCRRSHAASFEDWVKTNRQTR
jgi:hypothetical protein